MEFFRFIFGFGIDNAYDESNFFGGAAFWICLGTMLAVIAVLCVICLSNRKNTYNILSLAFAAVCIAASFGLSYTAIIKLPQGGTVTLASFLPICLYAYVFGFRRGLLAGVIYSLLQIIQNPYIVNLTQTLLDYILAFASVAISGLAPLLSQKIKKWGRFGQFLAKFDFSISLIFVAIVRFTCHVLAGVIFFGTFAPEGLSPFIYSISYNSFVFVDIAICIIPAVLLQLSSQFMRYIKQVRYKVTQRDKAPQTLNGQESNVQEQPLP